MADINRQKLIAGLAVLLVIVVIVGGATIAGKHQSTTSGTSTAAASSDTATASTTTNQTSTTSNDSSVTYKDGDYSGSANYSTPGGLDGVAVTLTLKDTVITAVTTTTDAPEHESEEYDNRFIEAYKTYVVGKKIDQISLSRVAGASLTSQGFNNALQTIITQAKA